MTEPAAVTPHHELRPGATPAPSWAAGCRTGALDPATLGAALELQRLRAAA